jgi:hypothetical protein
MAIGSGRYRGDILRLEMECIRIGGRVASLICCTPLMFPDLVVYPFRRIAAAVDLAVAEGDPRRPSGM